MIAISARQAWYAAQRMKWQPLGCAKSHFQAASTYSIRLNRHHQIAKIMAAQINAHQRKQHHRQQHAFNHACVELGDGIGVGIKAALFGADMVGNHVCQHA